MAKKRRKNSRRKRNILNVTRSRFTQSIKSRPLRSINQDDRLHRPIGKIESDRKLRITLTYKSRLRDTQKKQRLIQPLKTLNTLHKTICKARKARKEVIFALKKIGAGSSKRSKKRTYKSSVKC